MPEGTLTSFNMYVKHIASVCQELPIMSES